jgi:hypothetical protein
MERIGQETHEWNGVKEKKNREMEGEEGGKMTVEAGRNEAKGGMERTLRID